MSDGVSNLRQQIARRMVNPRRGRNNRVPRQPPPEPEPQPPQPPQAEIPDETMR